MPTFTQKHLLSTQNIQRAIWIVLAALIAALLLLNLVPQLRASKPTAISINIGLMIAGFALLTYQLKLYSQFSLSI